MFIFMFTTLEKRRFLKKSMLREPTDGSLLENDKENIQPLVRGRSAAKLASGIQKSAESVIKHRDELEKQRGQFESKLKLLAELDDPLQVYLDYIEWTHDSFPQGANIDSGLLILLERCTSCFRDTTYYKNDPRYLRVWLEYTNYSDSPRDIFVYLAKKEIGVDLALYYEEFAKYLEVNGNIEDAELVYKKGIEKQARPSMRLERSYGTFRERINNLEARSRPPSSRSALATKEGEQGPISECTSSRKKQKIEVYRESEESIQRSLFDEDSEVKYPGVVKSRIKENILPAKPWNGEVIKQKQPISKNTSKIEIYRDCNEEKASESGGFIILKNSEGKVFTLIEHPEKKSELVQVNMNLLYPRDEEECTFVEVLAWNRFYCSAHSETQEELSKNVPSTSSANNNEVELMASAKDLTLTIPLNDQVKNEINEHSAPKRNHPNSPTLTLYSRMATNEVINMFNNAGQEFNSDEEDKTEETDNTTNYDGFVTETIHAPSQASEVEENILHGDKATNNLMESYVTPKNEEISHSDEESALSSPFVEQPSHSPITHETEVFETVVRKHREKLLQKLSSSIENYPGYHNYINTNSNKIRLFSRITDKETKILSKGSKHAIFNMGDETICIRYELGRGGYGVVYLIETETGKLKALKAESPSSQWEFYILFQVHKRFYEYGLKSTEMVIKPESLFLFKDESYILMQYKSQGTILDIVNCYKLKNSTVDEVLCIFLTVDLLKLIEDLHSIDIIHCDLKADNCMVSLADTNELFEPYFAEGKNPWAYRNITLIDFGRAIDMRLYGQGARFLSNWETDEQDCPQMNQGKPWNYEADYYGLACIIHTMLFGNYIEISEQSDHVSLKNNFKRYWQTDLWSRLFDLLLNPYTNLHPHERRKPLISELRHQRKRFEIWLANNSSKRGLRKTLIDIEQELSKNHTKLLQSLR